MSNRDGVDNLVIYWDDDDGCYNAGQLLTGRVEVHVLKTTSFRGIRLEIKGSMKIKWNETDGGNIIPFEEYESLLNENLDIFTPNLKDKNARWIFPGKHIYNFKYQLPMNLPYCLDGSRYGRIEYKTKAKLLIPGTNPVESLEEEFFLHSKTTERDEAMLLKMEDELPKENVEYGVLGGGCFVKKSHVELFMKLEKTVYKQGQIIHPYVECSVEQGQCEVDAVMILLVQQSIFTCNLDDFDEAKKKESMVMGMAMNEEDADGGETEKYTDLTIPIDKNLPPTGFPHCDFIETGYFLHAVAKTNKLYDDVVVKLPIIILHGDPEDWEEAEEKKIEQANDETDEGVTAVVVAEVPDEAENDAEVEDVDEELDQPEEETLGDLPGQVEDTGDDIGEDEEKAVDPTDEVEDLKEEEVNDLEEDDDDDM